MQHRTARLLYPLTLAVALVGASQSVKADTVGLHLYSPHFDAEKDVPAHLRSSDFTPGVYWRGDSGLTVGLVRNSLKRWAVYGGHTFETDDGRWALTLGAITSYKYRRHYGQAVCRKGYHHTKADPCWFDHGTTNAHLRVLIAPSFAWHEAKPYIGATPRIALLGKAVSFSLEVTLP